MTAKGIIQFTLAALLVVALGALAGWYFFLRGQTQVLSARDAARGFGSAAPSFGGALGSAYQNAVSNLFGAGDKPPAEAKPQLWQVEKAPVAGFGFVFSGAAPRLYFIQRASGYVVDADPAAQTAVRLTNALMPKTYDAYVSGGGGVVLRSVDARGDITTFVGVIATTTDADSLHALRGISFPKNILAVAASPNANELLYILPDQNGKIAGVRAGWSGEDQKRVFTSGIGGWSVRWLQDDRLILSERPADDTVGYAYELRPSGLASLAGGARGLTVLPRASSSALIYGESSGGLSLFSRVSATSTFVRLPIRTTAEKCVWAPQPLVAYCAVPQTAPPSNFLDRWYRGEIHTSDAWWRVNVSAGTAEILYTPDRALSLDVQDPVIDQSGSYIAFKNAADQALWLLRITP